MLVIFVLLLLVGIKSPSKLGIKGVGALWQRNTFGFMSALADKTEKTESLTKKTPAINEN